MHISSRVRSHVNRLAATLVLLAVAATASCSNGAESGSTTSTSSTSMPATEESVTTSTGGATSTDAPNVRTVDRRVEFTSPTGNLHCAIDPEHRYAECGASAAEWTPPPTPDDCELDWGATMSVSADGKPADFVCRGDVPFLERDPDELPYGSVVRTDEIECVSERSGVTCTATGTGRGFTISRASFRFF